MTRPANSFPPRYATRGLEIALLSSLLITFAITAFLLSGGETLRNAVRSTSVGHLSHLSEPVHDDSWSPMLRAYLHDAMVPGGDIYDIHFIDRVKYQYPPASLLIFDMLPPSLTVFENDRLNPSLIRILSWVSRFALGLTIIFSALILEIALRRFFPEHFPADGGAGWRFLLMAGLGLTYYPLLKAYSLGQIQVFLNLFIVCAFFFHLLGWRGVSGVFVGVCCLVKPQYGILVLWALLRRNWRFLSGAAAVSVPLFALSALTHGHGDYVSYLKVLKRLSMHGETFWPNQSLNGFLNRLLLNGSPTEWSFTDLAPFHPAVYLASIVFFVVMAAIALRRRPDRAGDPGSLLDMMIVFAATTISSPIAWEHHYGAFLAIFAFAWPAILRYSPPGSRIPLLLLSCYLMMSLVMLDPELLFRNRWTGIAGSHLFFGAMLLFWLLLRLPFEEPGNEKRA